MPPSVPHFLYLKKLGAISSLINIDLLIVDERLPCNEYLSALSITPILPSMPATHIEPAAPSARHSAALAPYRRHQLDTKCHTRRPMSSFYHARCSPITRIIFELKASRRRQHQQFIVRRARVPTYRPGQFVPRIIVEQRAYYGHRHFARMQHDDISRSWKLTSNEVLPALAHADAMRDRRNAHFSHAKSAPMTLIGDDD